MKRINFLKALPLTVGALTVGSAQARKRTPKPALTIAHITDIHIRPELNIPERFKRSIEEIKKNKIDFFLNGGDSIHAADYPDITRERMLEQWKVWDNAMLHLKDYEVYSCVGNHDPWYAAPSKTDEMYGVSYAAKRVGMPHRYYSFQKKNWHFFILDGNNNGISLDPEQMEWLKRELDKVPKNHFVLLMSHFPILSVTNSWEGGQHKDFKELKKLFYEHQDKVKVCLSGHQHLLDRAWYNGVHYFCNGAMSGYWWEKGDEKSAHPYYYTETPPGYALLKLYENGEVENEYFPLNIS